MSHVYNEPIDIAQSDEIGKVPRHFLWRGRIYVVLKVLSHWVEADSWWSNRREIVPDVQEKRVWRIEAQSARSAAPGVYDLCLDVTAGAWTLARSLD